MSQRVGIARLSQTVALASGPSISGFAAGLGAGASTNPPDGRSFAAFFGFADGGECDAVPVDPLPADDPSAQPVERAGVSASAESVVDDGSTAACVSVAGAAEASGVASVAGAVASAAAGSAGAVSAGVVSAGVVASVVVASTAVVSVEPSTGVASAAGADASSEDVICAK